MSDFGERRDYIMARVLTENQVLLKGYLKEVGCKMSTIVRIISQTWEEDSTIKMLEFCRDNPNATEEELLKASLQILEQHNI